MSVHIVTDLAYGDSGKGTTTDWLSRQGSPTVVVRHNGGPQAGHNVVTPDGRHHEFSQWGAGTFAGAKTFLSRFMLVSPHAMWLEARGLQSGGVYPWELMHVDRDARIITPYHTAFNRLQSYARGESCGKGIGECMRQDIERPDLTIRVRDIATGTAWLAERLEAQRRHFLDLAPPGPERVVLTDDGLAAELADSYRDWRAMVHVVDGQDWLGDAIGAHNVVFEGAQGVLLDEWFGFHPFTTWSTTTHENALTLLDEVYDGPVTRLGVVRAYLTRHGAGPFVTEDPWVRYDEPHNARGPWQGAFRQGHFDFGAIRYAIKVCGGVDQLVVTHLDRSDHWKYTDSYRLEPGRKGDLEYQQRLTDGLFETRRGYPADRVDTAGLVRRIEERLAPIGLRSWGPTAADKVGTLCRAIR